MIVGPGTKSTTRGAFDATVLWPRQYPISPCPDAARPIPVILTLTLRGAGPKASTSSTPIPVESWAVVGRGQTFRPSPSPQDILLKNTFDILGEHDLQRLNGLAQCPLSPGPVRAQLDALRPLQSVALGCCRAPFPLPLLHH